MDNLFQNNKGNNKTSQGNTTSNLDDDIKFDENIDIDAIQKQLIEKMQETENAENCECNNNAFPQLELKVSEEKKKIFENKVLNSLSPLIELDAEAKKYVIYIDSDNIDYMEHLSTNDRRKIINNVLREQNVHGIKNKKVQDTKRFLQHALVAAFTFIIGFPIMFYCVNKSVEMTVLNYKQSKNNFTQLYKEQGKIKPANNYMNN